MISLTIKDNRAFMSHLLVKDTFDKCFLSQAEISTANTYTISGEINKEFYSDSEYEELTDKVLARWASIKPFCFSLIKGNKVPSGMKIVFAIPDEIIDDIISNYGIIFSSDDINGLFINVRYTHGSTTIVTGTSLRQFTLDKSLDNSFDDYIKKFLLSSGIDFEEF